MKIEIDDVTKQFGATVALEGATLAIEPGARVALVGPNGSGKTTLLRMIMGMLAGEGTVRVGGEEPFGERTDISAKLAYVPQIAPNIGAAAGRLVDLVCSTRGMEPSRVVEIGRELGFELPEHSEKPFRSLSGGMKQKLLIAMALAADPELLVMDEPTASLDAVSRRRFYELCLALPEETTILLCSHRLEEVRHLVNRVVALEGGRVATDVPLSTFVSERGRAAIEVQIDESGEAMALWFAEHGFNQVAPGRHLGFVPWDDKAQIVRDLVVFAGDRIEDLVVNDTRELEIEP